MTAAKAVVALLLGGLTVLGTALADNHLTGEEWIGVAIAVVTALGVYVTPNRPPGPPLG